MTHRHRFRRIASLVARNSRQLMAAVAAVSVTIALSATGGSAGNGRTEEAPNPGGCHPR